ncbi:MAG TPA: HDOD domain-containing protein [Tepidisphaeraceae bacterium]|nr:HDOD domain-containing protein [Tepidisphaeraceae bacterium]
MSELKEKRIELILQQLDELPTLPAVAVKLLEVTANDQSTVHEVVSLISSDPSLTARILQLVHRADVGVRGEVSSVERAVVLLGFEAVRSAVLAVSVFQSFGSLSERRAPHFSRDEFWKHCVATACCAELLAAAINEQEGRRTPRSIDPAEAFICGLLHDLGKIALESILPKSFSRVVEAVDLLRGNIADVERTVIGLDHMVVGKRLAERWALPSTIRDCAWLHGQAPQALPATVAQPRLVNLVTLADTLVRENHLGYSGNYTFSVPRQILLDAVGLSAQQVNSVMKRLVDQIEPRARALGLGQTSSGELYQQALAQANKELGRISGQLAAKNRRLAVRAKFFEALSGFQSGLRADAPPQVVLQAIAQTAIGVLGVQAVAVFSLPPVQHFAETVICDETGQVVENSLIDLPKEDGGPLVEATGAVCEIEGAKPQAAPSTRPPKPAPGDGPVLATGDEMDWFVSAVSPRLPHDQRFWICLEADGECIGGVVWGAQRGESQRLSPQVQEVAVIASGWSLALRTAQIREEARTLSEQLAESNRQLQNAQAEILRSKTMITVGEMAAGAAHEMNNPLAVISGRSQLLAAELSDPKFKAAAHLIHEQSHRLSAIITELMDFARPEPASTQQTELAEIVERTVHEAKMHNDPADRQFEVTLADVPPVVVDSRQVSAALTEVVANAIHATDPQSGMIEVHAAHDPYSNRVVVTVADNGCGMDENTAKRAFDPFFSAKPAGRRRGLGLAKALRWIEASGGSIRLESHPGQGTRCIILLPAAPPAARQNSPQATPRKAANQ